MAWEQRLQPLLSVHHSLPYSFQHLSLVVVLFQGKWGFPSPIMLHWLLTSLHYLLSFSSIAKSVYLTSFVRMQCYCMVWFSVHAFAVPDYLVPILTPLLRWVINFPFVPLQVLQVTLGSVISLGKKGRVDSVGCLSAPPPKCIGTALSCTTSRCKAV